MADTAVARLEARIEAEVQAAQRAEDARATLEQAVGRLVTQVAHVEQARLELERDHTARIADLYARIHDLDQRAREQRADKEEQERKAAAQVRGVTRAHLTPSASSKRHHSFSGTRRASSEDLHLHLIESPPLARNHGAPTMAAERELPVASHDTPSTCVAVRGPQRPEEAVAAAHEQVPHADQGENTEMARRLEALERRLEGLSSVAEPPDQHSAARGQALQGAAHSQQSSDARGSVDGARQYEQSRGAVHSGGAAGILERLEIQKQEMQRLASRARVEDPQRDDQERNDGEREPLEVEPLEVLSEVEKRVMSVMMESLDGVSPIRSPPHVAEVAALPAEACDWRVAGDKDVQELLVEVDALARRVKEADVSMAQAGSEDRRRLVKLHGQLVAELQHLSALSKSVPTAAGGASSVSSQLALRLHPCLSLAVRV